MIGGGFSPIVEQEDPADPPVFMLPGRSESHSEALAVNAVTRRTGTLERRAAAACGTVRGVKGRTPVQHVYEMCKNVFSQFLFV